MKSNIRTRKEHRKIRITQQNKTTILFDTLVFDFFGNCYICYIFQSTKQTSNKIFQNHCIERWKNLQRHI